MNVLIIDSSTTTLYVGLVCKTGNIYEHYINGKNDHAKNIVRCVDEVCKQANLEVNDLDRIVVGYGPGSYTGVRMAVTVGKMLAVFKKIPLYTISTLRLMASDCKGIVKVMIDARRSNAFACVFNIDENKPILEEGLYSYEDLEKYNSDYIIKDGEFKVNPYYCIDHSIQVLEPHLLVPNYLRETEAERNHHDS